VVPLLVQLEVQLVGQLAGLVVEQLVVVAAHLPREVI
jgi:hypothetical protein